MKINRLLIKVSYILFEMQKFAKFWYDRKNEKSYVLVLIIKIKNDIKLSHKLSLHYRRRKLRAYNYFIHRGN